jgi:hypothetical protein
MCIYMYVGISRGVICKLFLPSSPLPFHAVVFLSVGAEGDELPDLEAPSCHLYTVCMKVALAQKPSKHLYIGLRWYIPPRMLRHLHSTTLVSAVPVVDCRFTKPSHGP